jgi:hypothetical protein
VEEIARSFAEMISRAGTAIRRSRYQRDSLSDEQRSSYGSGLSPW